MSNITPADVRQLDLSLLRSFKALVEQSGVTHAAALLGVSQPMMSEHLKVLRTLFGDPLLTRMGRGSRPTQRADQLLGLVNEILQRVDALACARDEVTSPSDYRLTVRVAAMDYFQQILLERVLSNVLAQAPHLNLEFQRADRNRIGEWMEQGAVDLGIGPATVPSGRLHFRRLYRDEARCICSTQTLRRKQLTLDLFCELAHVRVMPARESFFDEAIGTHLRRVGRSRSIALTVPDFLTVPALVASAPVLATVPSMLLNVGSTLPRLDVRTLPIPMPTMDVGLYWHDRTHSSKAHKWLRTAIVDAF